MLKAKYIDGTAKRFIDAFMQIQPELSRADAVGPTSSHWALAAKSTPGMTGPNVSLVVCAITKTWKRSPRLRCHL